MHNTDVTIIIPHLGATPEQCNALRECFASLRETAPEVPVLVAKNGAIACQCIRHIRVLGQGQCKAVNAAIATTNTPYVLISNDDMIYPPGWFEIVSDISVTHLIACASAKLVEPRKGAPTFIEYFCGGAGGDFDKQKFLDFVATRPKQWNVEKGFNFPLLLHRELWDTIGGYDINYDPWGSNGDSDLEYKIMLAGVQPVQIQDWLVYHFSQTSGTFEPRNDAHRFRNYAYFKEKWGFERTDTGIWEADFVMPTKEDGRIFFPEWEGKYGR